MYLLSRLTVALGFTSPTLTLCVTVPVCVVASLAAGWAFHRWIEKRFLNGPAETLPPSPSPLEEGFKTDSGPAGLPIVNNLGRLNTPSHLGKGEVSVTPL